MTALGLDCGGSESRWLLLDGEGQTIARGTGPRLSGHIFDPAERDVAMSSLRTLCRDIRAAAVPIDGAPIDALVAGITGLTPDGPEGGVLADTLAGFLEIPAGRIKINDDLWLAYHAAFQPGEGILVYSGSGCAACHIDTGGQAWRAGGRGIAIDDVGSGFWIGQQALRWMMRQVDRTGEFPSGALASALCDRIGGRDWDVIRAHVYVEPRGRVAALALAVADAAKANDPVSLSILEEAGKALAELALALIGRVGLKPVVLTGRAAALHPAIFDTFDRALASPDAKLIVVDPAQAAARLALEMGRRSQVDQGSR